MRARLGFTYNQMARHRHARREVWVIYPPQERGISRAVICKKHEIGHRKAVFMAFSIGQRVTSFFTGGGTIQSGLIIPMDDTTDKLQVVAFDNDALGTRAWPIRKLDRVGEEEDDAPIS